MKTITVNLDDTEYVVPKLNIGQLERVTDALTGTSSSQSGYTILRIALERATPPADLNTFAPSYGEIAKAVQTIMLLSGFSVDKPKNVEAPGTAPGSAG